MYVWERRLVPVAPLLEPWPLARPHTYTAGYLGPCWLTSKSLGLPQHLGMETCFLCGQGFMPKVTLVRRGPDTTASETPSHDRHDSLVPALPFLAPCLHFTTACQLLWVASKGPGSWLSRKRLPHWPTWDESVSQA